MRRIDALPWHSYDTVREHLLSLSTVMSEYKLSIGRTKGQDARSGPLPLGKDFGTPKSHQLFGHLGIDICRGGLPQNYDSQAGESNHVQTRAHYGHTGK